MVKFCKEKFSDTSTNSNKKEFVSYQMGDVFCVKKDSEGQISFYY